MKIIIITDSYPPEVRSSSHLMSELAEGLHKRGHSVFVATSYPTHNLTDGKQDKTFPRNSVEDGIRVLRVRVFTHHNVNFLQKGLAQVLMPYLFLREIKKSIKEKIDAVIVHSPPLSLSLAGEKAARHFSARYILNVHDIFPQNAVDLGILKNKFVTAFFERMERTAYKKADVIMVPSETHKNFLTEKRNVPGNKIIVVPHWIDTAPFEKAERSGAFRKKYGIGEDVFILLFAGNFGPSQALDEVLEAASLLREDKNILFLFVGDGSEREKLVKIKKDKELENVIFQPLVSKEEYPALLKEVDAGIAALSEKNTTPAVPAKILGYMAGSIPVLAMLHNESEGLRLVEELGCGYSVPAGDIAGFASAIRKLASKKDEAKRMGKRGLKHAKENLSVDICLEKLERFLK